VTHGRSSAIVPLAKTFLFLVLVPGAVVGYVPYLLLGRRLRPPATVSSAAAIPLLGAGVAVLLWCMRDFAVVGRGTPAPIDPPRELVVGGLYRYVRNPMYVAVASILVGEAVLFRSTTLLVYAGAVVLFFTLFVVLYEQPTLEKKFGDSYRRYRREVPAWFPRLRRSPR
jgi:protein-S-isoprenylcysteine O-methyltransferase Ste14